MENWVTIKNLKKKNPGLGTRKIAKLLGISRSTVKRALASERFPRYHREQTVNRAIEPFEGFIRESFLSKRQKISVIYENLVSKGFNGSRISLYRYIAGHLRKERDKGQAYMPYETLPGEQMLYDWAEYIVELGGEKIKVYVHSTGLGFSRYIVLSASLTIRQQDVFEALEDAFEELGGVTARLQVDNARVFVDDASVAHFKWNDRFLELCAFYGIHPCRSLPVHPWSKGKIERPFAYIEDHFITNTRSDSFEDFYINLKAFQETMNSRIHSVVRQTPFKRMEEEKPNLLQLPVDPRTGSHIRYEGFWQESRRVTTDCLIAYGGNRYSVPHQYSGESVWVRVARGSKLLVYSPTRSLIATHPLKASRGQTVIDKNHYQGYITRKNRESYHLAGQKLKERFSSYQRMDDFISAVKAQEGINVSYQLSLIQRLFEDYAQEDCLRCMEECFLYNCFASSFIKGFFAKNAKPLLQQGIVRPTNLAFPTANVRRSLQEYRI
jgi:transposase